MIKPLSQSACKQAQAYYYDYICEEDIKPIPADKAEHIRQCAQCQAKINKLKYELFETAADKDDAENSVLLSNLKLHFAHIDKRITCREIKPFLPCLLHSALAIRIPTPITVHIDNCKQCRKDLEAIRGLKLSKTELISLSRFMADRTADIPSEVHISMVSPAKEQKLRNTVNQVIGRTESGVVTIYHIDKSAASDESIQKENIYAGFPIRVEVMTYKNKVGAEGADKAVRLAGAMRKKFTALNLRPLFKAAVVAAAVMMITAALFFHTPSARAISIDDVFKAISDIKNAYIAKFTPDSPEPQQEVWVSKAMQFYINRFDNKIVLWDVRSGVKKMKNLGTGDSETTSLTEATIIGIDRAISGHLGLVPFANVSEIPADAQWKQITEPTSEIVTGNLEIYDLVWTAKSSNGSEIFRKWRVFVNPRTNLPQKTEFYEKLPFDTELTLQTTNKVKYLDNSEIQAVINEFSL